MCKAESAYTSPSSFSGDDLNCYCSYQSIDATSISSSNICYQYITDQAKTFAVVQGSSFLIAISNLLYTNLCMLFSGFFRLQSKAMFQVTVLQLAWVSIFINSSVLTLLMYSEFYTLEGTVSLSKNIISSKHLFNQEIIP